MRDGVTAVAPQAKSEGLKSICDGIALYAVHVLVFVDQRAHAQTVEIYVVYDPTFVTLDIHDNQIDTCEFV
jgi:hypothetical protein